MIDRMGLETGAALEALVDVYAGAVFVIDRDGRYQEVIEGSEAGDMLYERPESLTGQQFRDVLPSETAERFHRVVEDVVDSGSPSVIEYELEVQAGRRWFEASVSPIDGGDRDRVLWAARDVTERKQYEQSLTALHEAGAQLTASDSVPGVCEEAIHAAETILDFDHSLILLERDGMLHAEAASDELPEAANTTISIEDGVAGETYRTGESDLTHSIPDSETALNDAVLQSGLSVAIGDHGVFQAMAETTGAFDETDLELAELLVGQIEATITRLHHERALERQNERLDEFTSIVSHDLRNPLTVASGRLELAAEDCDSEHLDHVADAHDRMQVLIDDLLTLAQSGEAVGSVEPVDLGRLARECWTLIETEDAALAVEAERTVLANESRLQQLLENLFGNAVEHGGDGVRVTVDDLPGGFVVADDGPGIDDADHEQLFEAGYSSTDGGTGIGLHIVDSIAERHGWEVTATESDDGGARFEITGVERPGSH